MNELELAPEDWVERARAFAQDGWWLADLCGLDRMHLGFDERFGICVQLLHRERKERQTIHVRAGGDPPTIPSVTKVWGTADFMEREAYDLMGIRFEGHPNLTRILMPDTWEGHPLRKDYGVGKVPVDFVRQPFLQIQGPGQGPNTVEADRGVDAYGQPLPGDAE